MVYQIELDRNRFVEDYINDLQRRINSIDPNDQNAKDIIKQSLDAIDHNNLDQFNITYNTNNKSISNTKILHDIQDIYFGNMDNFTNAFKTFRYEEITDKNKINDIKDSIRFRFKKILSKFSGYQPTGRLSHTQITGQDTHPVIPS